MEKRLAPEEANVANISLVQNAECAVELVGIYPAQVTGGHFPVSEIAEVALGVTGVGHGNIADRVRCVLMGSENNRLFERRSHI